MNAAVPEIRLNDGATLPALGFGTWPLKGSAGVETLLSALEVGWRLLDSAFNYENEGAVGEAVRRSGLARADLRIASKLPGRRHRYEQALETVEESLWRAGLDYYDLYLIHWPNPNQGLYVEAWRALVEAKSRGWVRSIGVSNFLPEHLDAIIADSGVAPSVNQVELHPYFPQEAQRAADKARGIVTESWSPLGRGSAALQEPAIMKIAEAHGKTPGQVVLRWHVQLGALALPKAGGRARQAENLAIFDFALSEAEMAAITALGRPDGRIKGQDPAVYEEF